jgi:hypothetical protein
MNAPGAGHEVSDRTRRIVDVAITAARVVAAAGLIGLVAIGLIWLAGQPWGTAHDLAQLVMTLALAPLMLAFYELGGRTPTPLARAAQASGWIAVLTWSAMQAAMIAGVVDFDYGTSATGAFAAWAVALAVIGLWVAGANLLAGPWLGRVRWLGLVAGLATALFGIGVVVGALDDPESYLGIGYQLGLSIWAILMTRDLRVSRAARLVQQPEAPRKPGDEITR